jgi:hypothetical protein
MISFKQFLAEEETLLNEVFAAPPFAERDSDAEAFAQKMVPPNTIHDVHVHKVEGMLPKHRIMSFTNNNDEREHHIMTMDNTHGRLGHDDISPSNSLAAYGHIVHKTKESIDKGQSTRFQVRDPRQYDMYHKTVSRMIDRSGKNATIHELGKQTSAQGFKIPTFVVEPN